MQRPFTTAILAALEQGRTVADVPPELMALYRPSVQPYLMSWFRLSPAAEIARIGVPRLVLQGRQRAVRAARWAPQAPVDDVGH